MSIYLGDKKLAGTSVKLSHNIGDIFFTSRTDTVLAGAVECNGATYQTTDYTGEGSIGELLRAGKLDYISLTAYTAEITAKGFCKHIGWNGTGSDTFRVPTLTPHIVQKNNIPVVGNGIGLGLTNGSVTSALAGSIYSSQQRLNKQKAGTQVGQNVADGQWGDYTIGVTTDPTKSGIIADLTNKATTERVMIQLFNGATDEAVATCNSVLANVADLKDLSNITATGKEVIAHNAMPSNRYVDLTLGASGASYTAPADGYYNIILIASSSAWSNFFINNNVLFAFGSASGQYYNGFIPVKKNDVLKIEYSNCTKNRFMFVYAEGAQ